MSLQKAEQFLQNKGFLDHVIRLEESTATVVEACLLYTSSVEFLNVAWDSVVEKETAAFAAGSGPDVSFQTEQFPLYAKNGYLTALDDYVSDDKRAGYPESALEYCSYDGQLMGVPFVALDSVMFYNKDLFEEAGITEVPTTWDELVDVAKKLTLDKDGDGETDQWGMRCV